MFIALYCMIGNAVSPCPRYAHESVVVHNNKLLVWGGGLFDDDRRKILSRCECFTRDLHSQQWSRKIVGIDSRHDEPTPCAYAQCAVINNMVYSFGGVLKSEIKLKIVDFNWAGKAGEVEYPLYLNRTVFKSIKPGQKILMKHDSARVDYIISNL